MRIPSIFTIVFVLVFMLLYGHGTIVQKIHHNWIISLFVLIFASFFRRIAQWGLGKFMSKNAIDSKGRKGIKVSKIFFATFLFGTALVFVGAILLIFDKATAGIWFYSKWVIFASGLYFWVFSAMGIYKLRKRHKSI